MNLAIHLKESLSNLFSAKLRSILAILGVLVGTASIVALIASSRLATDHALAQFKRLGTNLISLDIRDPNYQRSQQTSGRDVSLTFVNELAASSNDIALVAPFIRVYRPVTLFQKQAMSSVLAVTPDIASISKIQLSEGRFISPFDKDQFYCVIGAELAKKFKERGIKPLGQQINLGGQYFTIVGVAAPWEQNMFLMVNIDESVLVPIKSAALLDGHAKIEDILFRLKPGASIDATQNQITKIISASFPSKKLWFRNPQQLIDLVAKQRTTFAGLLIAIGSIALVVGGIGVMNIMLVSVIERRREIGIRMAVGARRWNILMMFLIESILLTVFGGIMGIVLGLGVTYTVAYIAGWGFHFYFMPPVLGFVVSVMTGILSGFYPAWRASKLDPISCLNL